jgi:hypothetical protein
VVPGNATSVGSPLAAFATVNGSTASVDTLQVFLSLWCAGQTPALATCLSFGPSAHRSIKAFIITDLSRLS